MDQDLSDEEIIRVATQMENPRKKKIDEANRELHSRYPELPALPGIGHHIGFDSKTNSGKTSAAKSMLMKYYRGLYNRVVIFARTIKYEDWQQVFKLDDEDLIDKVTEDNLLKVLHESEKRFLNEDGQWGPEKYNYFTLVIIDDLAGRVRKWYRFTDFLTMARHAGVTIWILSQDPMFIDPAQRANLWAYSIGSQYENIDDLERLSKGKSLVVKRSDMTSESTVPLAEGLATVRKINQDLDEPFGRLFVSTVGPGGFYRQNGHILDEIPRSELVTDIQLQQRDKVPPSLKRMTKKELLEILQQKKGSGYNAELLKRMTKHEIIELIET